jgi:hypothetical protein
MMYSPSENTFKAPQLGPGGCCFVQTVDLGLNPTPALTKCDLSPSATVNATGGTHFSYSLLECERGGTCSPFSLFFYSILGCQVSEFPSEELAQSHETPRFQYFNHSGVGPLVAKVAVQNLKFGPSTFFFENHDMDHVVDHK